MLCDYIYIMDWEVITSGKVREFTTFDKKEFEEVLKNIIGNKKYKLIEVYKLDLEEK